MGSHIGDIHLDENGHTGGSHDAIVGGGGNTHAQNDAAEHGQYQTNDHLVAGKGDNALDHGVSQAGHSDGAGDDTGDAAGCGYGNGALRTSGQGVQDLSGIHPIVLIEHTHGDSGENGQSSGKLNGITAGGYQIDQQEDRGHQIDLLQQGLEFGKFFLAQTLQTHFLGLQMDGDEDTGKVECCRQNGLDHDGTVGQLDKVCHKESGCAHNGRHDLTAGGSGCFRSGSEFRLVACLFHQGNGHSAGTYGVCHGGAGNHSFQGAGHHGHFGSTAGKATHDGIGNLNEEIRNAAAFQKGTEDNKYRNKLGADVDGSGEHTLFAVEQVFDGKIQASLERGIGKAPDERVGQKNCRNNEDGQTHGAPCHLCQGQNGNDTDEDLVPLENAALLDNGHGVEGKIQHRARAQDHEYPVIPGNVVDPLLAFPGGEYQITQQNNKGHEGGQPQFLQPAGKQSHIDAKQGKNRQNAGNNDFRPAFPDADIGFPIVLFHNGI